jgi:hypothetical protein
MNPRSDDLIGPIADGALSLLPFCQWEWSVVMHESDTSFGDEPPTDDDAVNEAERRFAKRVKYAGAGAMASALAVFDVFLEIFCSRFPLITYLIVAAIGYWLGGRIAGWMAQTGAARSALRGLTILLITLGVMSVTVLSFVHPVSNAKCAWKSCGRILGPGLFVSPFPPPPATCRMLSICANEYTYAPSGYQRLIRYIEDQGCPAP